MERHGTICVANTVDEAFLKAAYLEELAEIYYLTQNIKTTNDLNIFAVQEFVDHTYPKQIILWYTYKFNCQYVEAY